MATREVATHNLKCWPESFRAALTGRKTFEVRLADRDYQSGDVVHLLEYDPEPPLDGRTLSKGFTGRKVMFFIGYVERSTALPAGWCAFQLVSSDEVNRVGPALNGAK